MRECSVCHVEKELDAFPKDASRSLGHGYRRCRECNAAYQRAWREKNSQKTAAYRARNLEKRRAYYAANPERFKAQSRAYHHRHREKNLERMTQYGRDNPDVFSANQAKRRAAKLQATPAWLTETDFEMMKVSYAMRDALSERYGFKFHVDHIIPLQGENVCGLHVPTNLQVILASENMSKGNRNPDGFSAVAYSVGG